MTDSRPWYRTRPLPTSGLEGQFLVAASLFAETREALVQTALAGIDDGGHEGLVLWAGRELAPITIYTTAIIPASEHGPQGVHVSAERVGDAAAAARTRRLGILAQVHSHPGPDGRHSDGDDDLILLPFEGMLSIVVPYYGREFRTLADAAVHQFQRGRWVWCDPASVEQQVTVLPISVDLR